MLPLLRSMEARAQGLPAPRRLLILHHCQGSPIDLWRPAATATTTSFTLPANSAPFAPLQSKMVMIDGLNLVTASLQSTNDGGQNTSEGGMVALMTGVPGPAALARELSVLDFMRSDLSRLRTLAPASEKGHLDSHADAIQQLEAAICQSLSGGSSVCMTPAAPATYSPTSTGRQGPGSTE